METSFYCMAVAGRGFSVQLFCGSCLSGWGMAPITPVPVMLFSSPNTFGGLTLVCDFLFLGGKKPEQNLLGRFSPCGSKAAAAARLESRQGLRLLNKRRSSDRACLASHTLPAPGILGEFFTLGLSGERFVICHHALHPSQLQSQWLEPKG